MVLALAALAVLGGVAAVAVIGPRNVVGMLRYDQREEGSLKVGDRAPDLELVALDGKRVRLADHLGSKPAVLIFGSFT
ncbi:MAG TPA: hypothetical protein VND93_21850 [Myxococcales bacterium]|nr:hypothetical protein [Myxococcales bacterium]